MRKNRIFIVDDEEDLVKILEARLSKAGYEVFKALDGGGIIRKIKEVLPDLILLDIMMEGINGLEIKAKLNEDKQAAAIPVIFLTAKDSVSDKISGLRLGADDYITKPFNFEELSMRIESALKRRAFYEEISMTDSLTGLYNFNFFKKQIGLFFNIAKRYKKRLALAIIDVDNFKSINDTYGHLAGDRVLKEVSSAARDTLRKADIITRYGGDEFAIIMPETDAKEAVTAIERLKKGLAAKTPAINISAGIATYEDNIKNESKMFELADKRLYEDKNRKKN